MIESGRGSGFALKQREAIDGSRDIAARKFERDPAVELRVLGGVHVTHTAASERRQQDVVA
jgi:hypothetical protein